MNPIENYDLVVEDMAKFLDVTPDVFRNWQKRYGLLAHRSLGRGVPARFMFCDGLAAVVAKTLIDMSISPAKACKLATAFNFLPAFIAKEEVKIAPTPDGNISYGAQPPFDVYVSILLETSGWRLAEFIASLIEEKMGKGIADLALTEFRAAVDQARARPAGTSSYQAVEGAGPE